MKFVCGSCRTKYQISDEKIHGKILTIRCKKCGSKILVRESLSRESGGTVIAPVAEDERADGAVPLAAGAVQSAAAAGAVSAAPSRVPAATPRESPAPAALSSAFEVAMRDASDADSDDMPTAIAPTPANLEKAGVEWYVAIDGEQSGPFAYAELVRKLQAKEVVGRHYVWHDGMDGWHRARDVADLAQYLADKKKPPPPPGAPEGGADVVDLAAKRKEKGVGGQLEAPTEPKVEAKAPSAREEQLDHVLNEALGIQGEGATQRQSPGAIAMQSTAGLADGSTGSVDDLLAFDKDDIFANVPRASASDLVQRESTRFFVAAAGVNRQRSRNRIGIMLGVFAGLAFSLFLGAWAVGAIQISIPGIGNPFSRGTQSDDDEVANLDPSDPEQLKKILDDEARRRREGKPPRRRVQKERPKVVASNEPGAGGYVQDAPNGQAGGGTRGDDGQPESIKLDGVGGGTGGGKLPEARLPESGVDSFPAVERATLAPDTINKIINEKKKSVAICYQQSLRGNEDLRGKLEFLVTIEPNGSVSNANIETNAFKGTKLATCIAKKIKDWRFPPFVGEAQQVAVPFVLEKNSY